jgi:PAS domain S-box-containing protein
VITYTDILNARATAIENMSDFFLVLDPGGHVLDLNDAANELFGDDVQEVLGEPIWKIWPSWARVEEAGLNETTGRNEVSLQFGDEERVFEVNFSNMHIGSEDIPVKVAILHDVTTQKRARVYWENLQRRYSRYLERIVDERTRKLQESERMAAIGELAAMIGHDLRNPLTGISGAVYYLRNKAGHLMDDRGREMLELIEKKIEYSNKIISDLMDYSREIKLELSMVEVSRLVEEGLSGFAIPDGLEVVNRVNGEYEIEVDQQKFSRVLMNVVSNALDAMPSGGMLAILDKRVDDDVEISFVDTGAGIPDEIAGDIWKPLFTTKARGMGLGLAICKRMVEAHGGSISASSVLGRGTILTIRLPIRQGSPDPQAEIDERLKELENLYA